ncbi:MAG: hypothetical protein KF824_01410 [Fimbriimonadaceae bacterium]|nr:MAG: hypothetical protein KF824_01410 [Fimbriimonadaceae bacterium]
MSFGLGQYVQGLWRSGFDHFFAVAKFWEGFGKGKPTSQLISRQESLDVCSAYVGDLCQQLDNHFQKGELIVEDGMLGSSWHMITYKMAPEKRSEILKSFEKGGATLDSDNALVCVKDGAAYEAKVIGSNEILLSIYWD